MVEVGRRKDRGEQRANQKREKTKKKVENSLSFRESDMMRAEREPINIQTADMDSDLFGRMVPLLELAETKLWRWKTFPIILPLPITQPQESGSSTRRRTINIKDLFIEPNFNELDAVSLDSKGEPKSLNHRQLTSIRQTGEFKVDSVQFSGQQHTWVLTQLLQKGSHKTAKTFKTDLAKAISIIVVTGRRCLSDCWRECWRGWRRGLKALLDILIGLPSLKTGDLMLRLAEERAKYLVCELVPELPGSLEQLASFVRKMLVKSLTEKGKVMEEKAPMINFIYQTPQGAEIDLRLYSTEVMMKAEPALERILEAESQGWFPEYREKVVSELKARASSSSLPLKSRDSTSSPQLKARGTDSSSESKEALGYQDGSGDLAEADSSIQDEANRLIAAEYQRRVTAAILQDPSLAAIGPGVPQLLVDQLRAGLLFKEALSRAEQNLDTHLKQQRQYLKEDYPILSEIEDWMDRKLNQAKVEYLEDEAWSPHLLALRLCRENNLNQHAYFLSRDHTFLLDQEPVLHKELESNLRTPTQTFSFRTQIWHPSNWVIRENYKGRSEVIPTVVNHHTGKSSSRINSNSDDPVYLAEKETTVTNSTKNPFWRWTNFMHRTWSWFWNYSFLFLVVLPWCSPVSLRALLYLEPFYPDFEVSQRDGSLHKKASSETPTLASRLRSLWRNVSKSRTEFENSPDRGFLGKGVLRQFNRFVNYVVKGLCGTLLILLIFPAICVIVPGLSLALGLLGPILVPTSSLFVHLLGVVFYDFETGSILSALLPNIIFNIAARGVCLPVLGCLFSVVVCPLASAILAILAVARSLLRRSWDTVMFHLLIKKRARVPFSDTFVARRIAGPGMASNYFYQIKTEQALVALEATMEIDELHAFQEEMSEIISSPLEDYKNFISNAFKPLGVSVNKQIPGPYKDLEEETTNLLNSLNTKVSNRWSQLSLSLPESTRRRIKLTDRELRLALSRGAAMAQGFYPEHVIGRAAEPGGRPDFWQKRQLRENDWVGLVSSLYSSIFSPEFLVPMQQTDTAFTLKAEHWNLTRYLNMVLEDDWHDDLDVARAVHTPRGNINIQAPHIDRALFNPLQDSTGFRHSSKLSLSGGWSTGARKTFEAPRLCVPLPVPHPAIISMHIYNRDSDTPIRIEDCRSVLRDIREYPQPLSMEYLVGVKEVEEESAHSHHSRESIYEMGPELDSLTHSLEQLDTQVSLVKGAPRSHSVVESTIIKPNTNFHIRHEKGPKLRKEPAMSSQPTNYTRSQASLYNSPVLQRRGTRSQGSIGSARIASAEDVRIDNRDSIIDYHTAV